MHSLIRLRHIAAVARCGNFTLAAEECGISQPALSRSVQAFEEEYGLRLFDRGKGAITLTPAGRLAVDRAKALLALAHDFDDGMRRFAKGTGGRTGIGMGPLMASLLLPALGTGLLARSPQVTLITRKGPPDQMLDALLDGTLELIVANSGQLSLVPGVTQDVLGKVPLCIVVRAEHPLAGRGVLAMRELEEWPSARAFDHATGGQGPGSGGIVCEDFATLHAVTRATDCTLLVASQLVREDIETGRLVRLDIADMPNAEAEISLVSLRERTRSPASLALEEDIRTLVRAWKGD